MQVARLMKRVLELGSHKSKGRVCIELDKFEAYLQSTQLCFIY